MSKWMPTGLGAEPKKVMVLIGLLVASPVAYYYTNSEDAPTAAPAPKASRTTLARGQSPLLFAPRAAVRVTGRGAGQHRRFPVHH